MRYVAIGDSFTEGVGDEPPGRPPRGWADLVAEGLAAGRDEPVWYANLAVRGRLLEPIVSDQVKAAAGLDPIPDLVTMNGGGNDMLRPGADLDRLVELTITALDRFLEVGIKPVVVSGGDPSARLPFGRRFRQLADRLVEATVELTAERDLLFVNCFWDEELRQPHYWSVDRLHLSPAGHRRVAGIVLHALGITEKMPNPDPPTPVPRGPVAEARFYMTHVAPWVNRRLHGRSSGDGRVGKHLDWVQVKPPPAP